MGGAAQAGANRRVPPHLSRSDFTSRGAAKVADMSTQPDRASRTAGSDGGLGSAALWPH